MTPGATDLLLRTIGLAHRWSVYETNRHGVVSLRATVSPTKRGDLGLVHRVDDFWSIHPHLPLVIKDLLGSGAESLQGDIIRETLRLWRCELLQVPIGHGHAEPAKNSMLASEIHGMSTFKTWQGALYEVKLVIERCICRTVTSGRMAGATYVADVGKCDVYLDQHTLDAVAPGWRARLACAQALGLPPGHCAQFMLGLSTTEDLAISDGASIEPLPDHLV